MLMLAVPYLVLAYCSSSSGEGRAVASASEASVELQQV
jgi:hypothetical protein